MRSHILRLLAVASLLPLGAVEAAASARFELRGELQLSATSDDGRFSLRAEARVTPEAKSADGRFALKSTNASCDPLDLNLFKDGFET
ncbi:MAG: hypothetical protein IPG63_00295 [Xanthomonadales bacterium]|nr:hypothetical protein [Xanthomonadales bacterium]MCC6562196.1 hypothetical protein [Xanthomonadales bacterium]